MSDMAFPGCLDDMTKEWLTKVLHKNGTQDDILVTGFSTEPVRDPGAMSDTRRIRIEYNQDTTAPESLIGKFPPTLESARRMGQQTRVFLREVYFYKYLANATPGIAPRCYCAEIDNNTHDFVIIQEDLSELRLGNSDVTNPEDSAMMLERIAPFHAYWWENPDLKKIDWLSHPDSEIRRTAWISFRPTLKRGLETIRAEYENYMTKSAWSVVESMGLDLFNSILTWPGSAIDDWDVNSAIDRHLERACNGA